MGEDGEQKVYTHEIWEERQAQEVRLYALLSSTTHRPGPWKWNVSPEAADVIWSKANVGLLNAYRLFTTLWSYLTATYPSRIHLIPHTTVTSITSPSNPSSPYTIHTSRGPIKTPLILHRTNAFISHLVPSLRCRIVPVRLSLIAQQPGQHIPLQLHSRNT